MTEMLRKADVLVIDRFVVGSGQAGLGLETLIADLAMRCRDRPPSKISIYKLSFWTVQPSGPALRVFARCTDVPARTKLNFESGQLQSPFWQM